MLKRALLFFLFIGLGIGLFAQYTCKHTKEHFNGLEKSAADNLRSDTIDVLSYNIYLDFTGFSSSTLAGNCEIQFTPKQNGISTLSLDLLQLNIDSITHSSGALTYSYNDTLIVMDLLTVMNVGDTTEITVHYQGTPQTDGSGLGGFYFNGNYAYNLGVGIEADPHNYGRVWHPCFDNFEEKATYQFSILTNGGKTAYCNGERLNVQTVGTDSLLTDWQINEPIPSYLASVAVGDYTHAELEYVSPFSSDTIPIWLISEAGDTSDFKSSFINLQNAIANLENRFGIHQWNKVGFVAVPFNFGALEHATNIAYPLITINGNLTFEGLYAHEIAHHWFGNLLTCRTEDEMWINEGLATYCEYLFSEAVYDYDLYLDGIRDNHHVVLHLAHVNDAAYHALSAVPHAYTYGDHSYLKGADVAHTMRTYMGDSLFFLGLKTVLANNQFGNISTTEFRDQLNAINGIDVTDFFNDWIMNPGFPHFSIDSVTTVPNGPNFDVTVYVQQKLRGAPNYYNNVPLEITFMDAGWLPHTESLNMSGQYATFNYTIPINPVLSELNMGDQISHAVTTETRVINSLGLHNMPNANFRVTVTNVTDSAYIHVGHHWAEADSIKDVGLASLYDISSYRYWSVKGILPPDFESTVRFQFNGQETNAGYLDNDLLANLGTGNLTEDSVKLFYRTGPENDWTEFPSYTIGTTGQNNDKRGDINLDTLLLGEYVIGFPKSTVNIDPLIPPHQNLVNVFPNPSTGSINIDLSKLKRANYTYEIYDITGKLIEGGTTTNKMMALELHADNGTYSIVILQDEKLISTAKFVLQK